MAEKVIEYGLMGIVSISGWVFAVWGKALTSSILEKVSDRFVLKEMHEKELANIREGLRVIETKLDKLMEA